MTKKILNNVFLLAFLLFSATWVKASEDSEVDSFVNHFKKTVTEKNIDSILSINVWDGLPEGQKNSIEKSFEEIINKGILNIKTEYIENGDSLEFNKKGNVFAPNLSPVAKVYVEINTGKSFRGGYSYYIGRDNGELKFSHVVLKKKHNNGN